MGIWIDTNLRYSTGIRIFEKGDKFFLLYFIGDPDNWDVILFRKQKQLDEAGHIEIIRKELRRIAGKPAKHADRSRRQCVSDLKVLARRAAANKDRLYAEILGIDQNDAVEGGDS